MTTLRLALRPRGALELEILDAGDAGDRPGDVDAETRGRIERAFGGAAGSGLLHLATVELTTPLEPSLGYFRQLATRYVTALCKLPDLDVKGQAWPAVAPPDGEELARLVDAAPPMNGAEYLDVPTLERCWAEVESALRAEVRASGGTVQAYLQQKNGAWNSVGRVCFHLAENRDRVDRPFAFLATYTTRLSARAKAQHRPLGQALRESVDGGDRQGLLALLQPVERAAAKSPWLRRLVDGGEIFHPLAWTADEAHALLREVPALEEAGLTVRVPDWWRARRRLRVSVSVGERPPAGLGMEALLDFSVRLALDDTPLTDAEWKKLRAATGGLVLIRGAWVELDRERLESVMAHWKKVQASLSSGSGLTFAEALRLLAGDGSAGGDGGEGGDVEQWSQREAGTWLRSLLERLRSPEAIADAEKHIAPALRATLRPYQRVGTSWLWLLHGMRLGACLADDMGLGKTLQVLALLTSLQRGSKRVGPHLLVVPASLIPNWQSEIARFAPSLRTLVAHPSVTSDFKEAAGRLDDFELVITTYSLVARLSWLARTRWDLVILDEAQAIKNPAAKQTRAVKTLPSHSRIALTGTPIENRLGDLWSLFDFLNPGLLGTTGEFTRFTRRLASQYAPLRQLVRPYLLRRLKTDRRVIDDLPEKTEVRAFCALTPRQAALYQESVDALAEELGRSREGSIERRGRVLAFLMRFKQICNHPSHWTGDREYAAADSGKFARLREICEVIASRQEKVLVFTQFREMTQPLADFLQTIFGGPSLVLDGSTPVRERKQLVDRFQTDDAVSAFVLSLKAGGVGLNLTAASHVVHFDRWWNPAVENQATDRAFRIGQKKNVLVHKFVCRGTLEERIDALLQTKQGVSRELLEGAEQAILTELSNADLLKMAALDIHSSMSELSD